MCTKRYVAMQYVCALRTDVENRTRKAYKEPTHSRVTDARPVLHNLFGPSEHEILPPNASLARAGSARGQAIAMMMTARSDEQLVDVLQEHALLGLCLLGKEKANSISPVFRSSGLPNAKSFRQALPWLALGALATRRSQ